MKTHVPRRSREHVAAVLAGIVAAHGMLVLAGWWMGITIFLHPTPFFIPMAPSTAFAFLSLGVALIPRLLRPQNAELLGAGTLLSCTVAVAALLNLLLPTRLDQFLGGDSGFFGIVRLGVMSPVTATAILPLACAVALARPGSRGTGIGGAIAAIVGATVALGYAYGTPLLYGSSTIPVSLATALSLLLLGVAAVLSAGPSVWPLRPLWGDGTRARMLRAFLPATVALVLFIGILEARFSGLTDVNQVLVSAWLAVVGLGFVTWLVSGLARRTSAELDRAYAERHHAEQRYREIFEQLVAGVATTGLDGRILLCNAAFARIFGYDSPAELMERHASDLYWEPEDRDRVLSQLRATGQLRNFELRMRRKDGSPVWVFANLTLHPANGAPEPRIENTVIDITERKNLEQQLWQAQKLDALGSLAGGVAHDFNNLLTAITGFADLMREDLPDGDPHLADLDEIDRACGRASALTRQLLAFSRRQPFDPQPLRLDRHVQEMEKMLQRLLGPAVRLVIATSDGEPQVWADPSQMEQVVLNLAVNARDAMPAGGTLTIETQTVQVDETLALENADLQPGSYVQLSVSDTGTGMARDTIAHMFEPFFTTKEKGKGTGLGLATVYGIVKQTRGHILVYSEVGIGTTFKCLFPVTTASFVPAAPPVTPLQIGGRETVLIVEDEPAILKLAVSSLEHHGYHVLPAADGDAAIRIADEHPGVIHLLLSDGVLSGMRVPYLLRRVRARRPETRMLLMSGYSKEVVFPNDIVEPNTAFLAKPFTARQLVTRVREVLDGQTSGLDADRSTG